MFVRSFVRRRVNLVVQATCSLFSIALSVCVRLALVPVALQCGDRTTQQHAGQQEQAQEQANPPIPSMICSRRLELEGQRSAQRRRPTRAVAADRHSHALSLSLFFHSLSSGAPPSGATDRNVGLLTLYANGFIIGNGEFRDTKDPKNQRMLADLKKGSDIERG